MRRPASQNHGIRTRSHKHTEISRYYSVSHAEHFNGSNLHSSSVPLAFVIVVSPLISHRHGEALQPLHSVFVGLIKVRGEVGPPTLHLRQLLADRPQDVVPRLDGLKKLVHLLLVDVAAV